MTSAYWLSLLSPADVLTMIALAAIMLVVERQEEVTLQGAWLILIAAALPLGLWAAACAGMHAPAWLRYVGMFVIWGVVLATREAFSVMGAALAAAVLLVANVGITALMK